MATTTSSKSSKSTKNAPGVVRLGRATVPPNWSKVRCRRGARPQWWLRAKDGQRSGLPPFQMAASAAVAVSVFDDGAKWTVFVDPPNSLDELRAEGRCPTFAAAVKEGIRVAEALYAGRPVEPAPA